MQFTQKFIQHEGTSNVATIIARKVKWGFVGVIKISGLSKTVTGTHLDVATAHEIALRELRWHKENAIV